MENTKKLSKKIILLLLSLVLVLGLAVGGTVAYLVRDTDGLTNHFDPARMEVEILEDFDGTTKSSIRIHNKGDVKVYAKVQLITYMTNAQGEVVLDQLPVLAVPAASGWVAGEDNTFYYLTPIASGASVELLAAPITLAEGQVVEVMAEIIQAEPADAWQSAWNIR